MFIKRKLGSASKTWVTPKAQKHSSRIHGHGLFCRQPIAKDEIVVIKAGHIIDREAYHRFRHKINDAEAQIADNFFIAPLTNKEFKESMAYVNHSCEPNLGFGGNVLVVAMRDISPGEEMTIDYATHITDSQVQFACSCGSNICRGYFNGNDWQIPELQQKYAGYFQWYIEQKIKNSD